LITVKNSAETHGEVDSTAAVLVSQAEAIVHSLLPLTQTVI